METSHSTPQDVTFQTEGTVTEEKPRLSTLIKVCTTKSRLLVTKKSLPVAHHERFQSRKPWRRSQPRLEKRLLVKATLDNALRVLSRHQSRLLNGEVGNSPDASFDDVDVGEWTLVRQGDRTAFHETTRETETTAAAPKRRWDAEEKENDASNKRFKADNNNNNNEKEEMAKGHAKDSVTNERENEDEDDDVIIDIESDGEPERKEPVTELNWQWLPTTSNVSFYPPPPPPISPPLPPHLLQPPPPPAAGFDYDYYFYCLRFFYHYRRFTAAREMTGTNATFVP